jgi:N-acyl-D-aspartate/D-glutamate deacylase
MTGAQAALFGFADRGRIARGAIADINIIDHAALTLDPAELRHDLPGGGQRLLQCATGYIATLVAGVPIVERDSMTAARPGRVFTARSS